MDTTRELGRFLRSRRSRVEPPGQAPDVTGRRRVSGLRREEVAALAGVSAEYYVRLEQGRARNPSSSVLNALSRALGLDDVEHAHLVDLAAAASKRESLTAGRGATRTRGGVRPELAHLLTLMERTPAMIYDHRMDVLAWNDMAAELIVDFAALAPVDRNLARFGFLHEQARERFPDWEDVGRTTVGQLRLAAGRHPDDPGLARLIGELTMKSAEFRDFWNGRDVRLRTNGIKRFRHPAAGDFSLRFENLDLPRARAGDHEHRVIIFSADPGTEAENALDLIGRWSRSLDAGLGPITSPAAGGPDGDLGIRPEARLDA
ncbi:helix-turn-helix transcriptional regulator [Streptosporangium longisporum]|uniref:Helix-turn-helix transcriptional regulator n=1 Tax=Streptosporangium longisporum TaxID=46187 RepID=A0ABP6L8Z3_9ACTN